MTSPSAGTLIVRSNTRECIFWGKEDKKFVLVKSLEGGSGVTCIYYDSFTDLEREYLSNPKEWDIVPPLQLKETIRRTLQVLFGERHKAVTKFNQERTGTVYDYTPRHKEGNLALYPLPNITGYYIFTGDTLSIIGTSISSAGGCRGITFKGEDAELVLSLLLFDVVEEST